MMIMELLLKKHEVFRPALPLAILVGRCKVNLVGFGTLGGKCALLKTEKIAYDLLDMGRRQAIEFS